jgi:hypothetical protein
VDPEEPLEVAGEVLAPLLVLASRVGASWPVAKLRRSAHRTVGSAFY